MRLRTRLTRDRLSPRCSAPSAGIASAAICPHAWIAPPIAPRWRIRMQRKVLLGERPKPQASAEPDSAKASGAVAPLMSSESLRLTWRMTLAIFCVLALF